MKSRKNMLVALVLLVLINSVSSGMIRVPDDQATISAAVAAAGASEEIRVQSTHIESATVSIQSKTLSIVSYNLDYSAKETGAQVVTTTGNAFVIDGSTVTLEGLAQIKSGDATGILLQNVTSTLTLTDCTISECGGDGIDQDVASTLALTGCTISDNTSEGLFLDPTDRAGAQSLTVSNCTLSDNGDDAIEWRSGGDSSLTVEGSTMEGASASGKYGILFRSYGGTQTWTVSNSTFGSELAPNQRNICVYGQDSAALQTNVTATIDDCVFYGSTVVQSFQLSGYKSVADGGNAASSFDVTVTNCLIQAGPNGCVGSLKDQLANIEFRHCTLVATSAVLNAIVHSKLGGTITLNNCIISGEPKGVWMDDEGGQHVGTIVGDYNLINSATETEGAVTLTNGLSGDPLFESASDFHLTASSPAVNAGADLSVAKDLDGVDRDANPDMGCYEYASSSVHDWYMY